MDLFSLKILIVDDHKELLGMICNILKRNGYTRIVTAESFRAGLQTYRRERPALAVLDIMLPDGNGYALFQEIRRDSDIPILFLSAKDEDADRIMGLGMGADDYITKPFLPQELVLRIGTILRRSYGQAAARENRETEFTLGNRKISMNKASVEWPGGSAALTATEMIILEKLYQNRGNLVTFDAICQAIWQDGYYGYENTLMVHIRHLRQKIEEDSSHPKYLVTVRGVGYRLVWEEKE